MSAGHSHAVPGTQNERKLWFALGLSSTFLALEAIGGCISDAAQMMTDAAARSARPRLRGLLCACIRAW
jgi:cobalt-zinc-cadmium efflux system protein